MSQTFEEDQIEDRLCLTLHQTSRAMTAAYRKVLEPLDLTYPQYTVLSALWRSDPVTVKELGDVLGTGYNTVSPLIKRLETKDLVERARNGADEREVLVHLTQAGRRLQRRTSGVQTAIRQALGLSDASRERLVRQLQRLTERLDDFAH